MTPDTDVLFVSPHVDAFQVAKKEDVLNCTTIEDIDNLEDNPTSSYRARNFIPIPPFLMQTVASSISANQGNAKKILLEVASVIKIFDTAFDGGAEYK